VFAKISNSRLGDWFIKYLSLPGHTREYQHDAHSQIYCHHTQGGRVCPLFFPLHLNILALRAALVWRSRPTYLPNKRFGFECRIKASKENAWNVALCMERFHAKCLWCYRSGQTLTSISLLFVHAMRSILSYVLPERKTLCVCIFDIFTRLSISGIFRHSWYSLSCHGLV